MPLRLDRNTGARFSPCRAYHYALWRGGADGPALLGRIFRPKLDADSGVNWTGMTPYCLKMTEAGALGHPLSIGDPVAPRPVPVTQE